MNSFSYQVPGKWILAGEHAVLRGSEALVFPLKNKHLDFTYKNDSSSFKITITGTYRTDLELFIWSLIEKYLEIINIKRENLTGHLEIKTEIQFGAGMGASATLAVGLSLFFSKLGYLKEVDLFHFSKKIEDLFHGESSGVDVAVALNTTALIYKRGETIKLLKDYKLPFFCISYSGQRGVTKDCVEKVKALLNDQPEHYQLVDARMRDVVGKIKKMVEQKNIESKDWVAVVDQAQSCFLDWGLVPDLASEHIHSLKKLGALSCKMTGSGGGGYILSLWPADFNLELLPTTWQKQLIPVER